MPSPQPPLFRGADSPPSPAQNRIATIDGLRGFLALAVFFHHGTIYRNWLLHHLWAVPPSRFYTQLGQSGVAFFFMITGYLFWSRLLRHQGRINFRDFYIGRLFRLAPLYLFAVTIMLCIVFRHTGLTPKLPMLSLLKQLAEWAAFGFYGSGPDVNGYAATSILVAGVMWSLQYEWLFYLSLMALSFPARLRNRHLHLVLFALLVMLLLCSTTRHARQLAPVAFFLSGMVCGSLEANRLLCKLPDWLSSSAIMLLLTLDLSHYGTAYRAVPIILMGLCFYLIVSGSKIFGLLTSRAAIRLGDISYGTYLLQGLVLYALFSSLHISHFALASPTRYWLVLLICLIILVFFAMASHLALERPGIDLGKRAAKALPANMFPRRKLTATSMPDTN